MCFGSGFFAVHCWIRIDFAEDFEAPTDVCESGMEPSASKVAAKKNNAAVSTQIFTTLKLIIRLGANFLAEILPDLRSSSRPPVLKHTWALRN